MHFISKCMPWVCVWISRTELGCEQIYECSAEIGRINKQWEVMRLKEFIKILSIWKNCKRNTNQTIQKTNKIYNNNNNNNSNNNNNNNNSKTDSKNNNNHEGFWNFDIIMSRDEFVLMKQTKWQKLNNFIISSAYDTPPPPSTLTPPPELAERDSIWCENRVSGYNSIVGVKSISFPVSCPVQRCTCVLWTTMK